METTKDIIYIVSATVSLLFIVAGIFGIYWKFHFRMARHDERITKLELYREGQEGYFREVDRKLMIIERNLVKVMEKLNVEPVRDLEGNYERKFKIER